MAKEPRLGLVKTRLARGAGAVRATRFYRAASVCVIARLAASTRWQTWLAVSPGTAVTSRSFPAHVPRRPQVAGDLGGRMQNLFEWSGAGPIVIVGTDIPAIRPAHIAQAFRLLGASDVVLGPAGDGGYWLVGLRRSPRIVRIFGGVRWSSEHALADTAANCAGLRVAVCATLSDVDDADALASVEKWCGRRVLPLG